MLDELEPLRQRLVGHSVYRAIGSMEDLRFLMQSHVFAVLGLHGVTTLEDCLERHIHLDAERHIPMAGRMLERLCQEDEKVWVRVRAIVAGALEARIGPPRRCGRGRGIPLRRGFP